MWTGTNMKGLELSGDELVKCENAIEESIVKMVELSNLNGAIIALSGGIDSALVATLASRVVDVYGLLLPDTTSNKPQDAWDARALAKSLGISCELIEIDRIIEAINVSRPKVDLKSARWPMPMSSPASA